MRLRTPFLSLAPRAAACGALVALVAAGGTAAPVACSHNPKPGEAADTAEATTTVRVQNQAFLDANVYVLRGSIRVRLGRVTGNTTAVLAIPRSLIQPATPLRFVTAAIGGRGTPVSEEVLVSPGDEVGLVIPPGSG